MLTRPGSSPGPEWMRKLDASSRDPREHLRTVVRLWLFYGLPMFAALFLGLFFVPQAARHGNYESPVRIGGMPLLSTGSTPRGVIAIGGRATGILAIGGIAIGWIALGGIAGGGVALGGFVDRVLCIRSLGHRLALHGWRSVWTFGIGWLGCRRLRICRYGSGVRVSRSQRQT